MKSISYNHINVGDEQNNAFIFIHGWQGNKDSFKSILKLLKIDNYRFYFPEGPYLIDGNEKKRSWAIQVSDNHWETDLSKSLFLNFLEGVVFKKFHAKNVFIMGFSQGAAVCLNFILSLEYSFGGIFPVAGFSRMNQIEIHKNQYNTPILIGHGKDDDVISVDESKRAYNQINKVCNNVEFYIFNGKHKISLSYLNKVRDFLLVNKN
jgi:phospholipase/carboxylesterase